MEERVQMLSGISNLVSNVRTLIPYMRALPSWSNHLPVAPSWRRHWRPTPVLLPGESHGWRSPENPMDGGARWAVVHGVARSRIQLSNFTFTFHFHALEKEMAIYSSVLAWRIPGTGEPGGLPSMGSHRVGHDWSDLAVGSPLQIPSFWGLGLNI